MEQIKKEYLKSLFFWYNNNGDNMKNNKGFSLVELLAVVAIISILFGIGMADYTRYTVKARE